jgi:hypothetical protein
MFLTLCLKADRGFESLLLHQRVTANRRYDRMNTSPAYRASALWANRANPIESSGVIASRVANCLTKRANVEHSSVFRCICGKSADGITYRCLGSRIVQRNIVTFGLDSQAVPQCGEIRAYRRHAHLRVELLEHGDADGIISRLECAIQRPLAFYSAAGSKNSSERVDEPAFVVGALANFNIGEQTEHRATPVSAAPTVRAIKSLVARRGHPLG